MRGKFFKILTVCLILFTMLCTLVACGGHKHAYNKQVPGEEYLASEATCDVKAQYYLSCECGEKGEDTFEYGEVSHNFDGTANCADCGDAVNYTLGLNYYLWEGSYTVALGNCTETAIILAAKYKGKPVTNISSFKGSNITSIQIPEGITTIDDNAFANCTKLGVITIPASVNLIGSNAFQGAGLTSVTLVNPNGWCINNHLITSNPKPNADVSDMSDSSTVASWLTSKQSDRYYQRVEG